MDDRTVMSFLALYEYQDKEAGKEQSKTTSKSRDPNAVYSG
jgi:hypothetical protein